MSDAVVSMCKNECCGAGPRKLLPTLPLPLPPLLLPVLLLLGLSVIMWPPCCFPLLALFPPAPTRFKSNVAACPLPHRAPSAAISSCTLPMTASSCALVKRHQPSPGVTQASSTLPLVI